MHTHIYTYISSFIINEKNLEELPLKSTVEQRFSLTALIFNTVLKILETYK